MDEVATYDDLTRVSHMKVYQMKIMKYLCVCLSSCVDTGLAIFTR